MPRDDVAEPKDDDSVTYLVRKLRHLLKSESKDQSLRDLFARLDKNKDKGVTAVEFRKGLKDLGFRLDDDEVRDIVKYCDVDGDGEISYLELTLGLFGCVSHDTNELFFEVVRSS
jgi:Ca2+-binding EF-hand superfamily protein